MALLLGVFAVLVTPREEEPQINVTMANVLIPFPGASARDVEQMVATPAEQVLSQIAGIEHVMSVSRPGLAVITVQFKVGVPRTEALVRLYDTVNSNADWLPKGLGVGDPIIKPKGIDDVPIVTLTLYSKNPQRGAYDLERVAHSVEADLKRVPGTREVTTIGGPGRAVLVEIDPARMAGAGVTVPDLRQALQSANLGLPVGELLIGNRAVAVESGPFLRRASEVAELVVGVHAGKPVFLRDVATVRDGPLPPSRYVWHGVAGKDGGGEYPAVTIAVTKKPGENAIDVANAVMRRVEMLRNTVIPADVRGRRDAQLRRDRQRQGAEADPEAAVRHRCRWWRWCSLALGRREAAIVGTAVILTLTATLFASWAWGFTLNRVSLFALIFSIGILVDDAIVVVENIHRHQQLFPASRCWRDHPGRGRRGRRPDHPGHADRDRRAAADGLRVRPDGAVHEPDPDQRQHGHADVAGDRVHRHALAGAAVDEGAHARRRARTSPRRSSRCGKLGAAVPSGRVRAPFLDDDRRGARNRRLLGLGIAVLIAVSLALPATGLVRAEDAALRQQVGVPGRRRHARRHAGRADRRGAARAGRLPGHRARGDRLPGLCRHRRADQLQRPGAPVLPARRRRRRRPAGQPGRQAPAQRAEPRDRDARAARRCRRSAGASAPTSRWSKCRPGRRCCRRSWPRSTARRPKGRREGRQGRARGVREDAGRGRCRRQQHRCGAEDAAAGRPPQGGDAGRAAGSHRQHLARRPGRRGHGLPARREQVPGRGDAAAAGRAPGRPRRAAAAGGAQRRRQAGADPRTGDGERHRARAARSITRTCCR